MKYHDSVAQANEKMSSVQQLLAQHKLAATPINYHVLYEYVSGKNSGLTSALKQHLSKQKLDNFVLEEVFEQHINKANEIKLEIVNQSEQVVRKLNDSLAHAEQAVSDFLGALDNSLIALDEHSTQTNKQVISWLVDASYEVKLSQRQFQEQLLKAGQQNEALLAQVNALQQAQYLDTLTGLYNRKGLEQKLALWLATDANKPLAAITVNIDHFDQFNQAYGYMVGDVILSRVAQKLKSYVVDSGVSVRSGGEEFTILLPDVRAEDALEIADQMRSGVEKLKFISARSKRSLPKVTVSMGIASYRNPEPWQQFIQRSIENMRLAKQHGRNRVQADSRIS